MAGIYTITRVKTGELYVGQTSDPWDVRWRDHKSKLSRGVHHSHLLQAAWNKYGKAAFRFAPIEEVFCESTEGLTRLLNEREQHWIDNLPSGYNICKVVGSNGGGNRRGLKNSAEHREKIAAAKRGIKRPPEMVARMAASLTGRKLPDATKQKMSEAQKNSVKQKKHLAKLSASNVGRECSEEKKIKLSEAQKGKKLTDAHRQKLSASASKRQISEDGRRKLAEAQKRRWAAASSVDKAKISAKVSATKKAKKLKPPTPLATLVTGARAIASNLARKVQNDICSQVTKAFM